MNSFGLDDVYIARIVEALTGNPKVSKILLVGSRARGNFKSGSDIDLAVSAPGLSFNEYLDLTGRLSDLPIVFKMDLVHLEALPAESPLAAQIARDGITLYTAAAQAA
jgi:proline iminopeptidase